MDADAEDSAQAQRQLAADLKVQLSASELDQVREGLVYGFVRDEVAKLFGDWHVYDSKSK